MIKRFENYYLLNTENTSYVLSVMSTKHLEHLYYGRKIKADGAEDLIPLVQKRGAMPGDTSGYCSAEGVVDAALTMEYIRQEFSTSGKGDINEPCIEVIHSDGAATSDYLFEAAEVLTDKPSYITMPTAYANEPDNTLKVTLKDPNYNLTVELYYCIFEKEDVITRMTVFKNTSGETVRLRRLMSAQLDMEGTGYVFTTFNGAWTREMHRFDTVVNSGKHVNSAFTGTSSNRANPFVMISTGSTTEDLGEVIGVNLIYSGNHMEVLEATPYGQSRLMTGINPRNFEFTIEPGEEFEAPEAVMTYSDRGFNGMSHNMHDFVSEHIIRGSWKHKERPILLNSWEACYFNINENRLLSLAKEAASAGMELFVMDDGWFGERDGDDKSLGDWTVNKKKLPGGLEGISKKVNALGLEFGIWVEPEMVNRDSDLYRAHPDWAIVIPGKPHSEGRNQMLLDITREDVRDYIINAMSDVFSSGNIAYVKWDMNRCFTDIFSQGLGNDRQGEVLHRYVTGLYSIMKTLTEKFPDILFEGCSSGGNRFDLGILSYFPQIWASDDTDALERTFIQNGYSYGYPQSTYTCHVSGVPNHQTLRRTPLTTRFNVAAFGNLGYELNLREMDKSDLSEVREQVQYYKEHRKLFQFGRIYRGRCLASDRYGCDRPVDSHMGNTDNGNKLEWTIVSDDGSEAVAMIFQDRVIPNAGTDKLYVKGLNPDWKYDMSHRALKYNIKDFGNLINTVSPIHVKEDSLVHNAIDRFYKLDGENDSCSAYGSVFMDAGIYVTQAFVGTGFNDKVKYYQDMCSRMYYLKKK